MRSASLSATLAMLVGCILFGSAPLLGGWYFGFLAMTAGFIVQFVGLFLLVASARAFGVPQGWKAALFLLVLGALIATYAVSGTHDRFKARMHYHTAKTFERMGKPDKAKESYDKAYELDPALLSPGKP